MTPAKKKLLWVLGIAVGFIGLILLIDAVPYTPAEAENAFKPVAAMTKYFLPLAIIGLAIDQWLRRRKQRSKR